MQFSLGNLRGGKANLDETVFGPFDTHDDHDKWCVQVLTMHGSYQGTRHFLLMNQDKKVVALTNAPADEWEAHLAAVGEVQKKSTLIAFVSAVGDIVKEVSR